jgi:beta-amylase
MDHGKLVLQNAVLVFDSEDSPFKGVNIGAKIPGIHWRMASDRLAELNSGVIPADDDILRKGPDGETPRAPGYENIVSVFAQEWANRPAVVLHFTCLERDNHEDQDNHADSLAKTLVFWLAATADQLHVPIKGENALSGPLSGQRAWDNLKNAIEFASYQGLTLLRIGEFDDFALSQYGNLIKYAATLNK